MTKKKSAVIFLILAVLMVLFFTFQEPKQSRDLSEAVRMWLGKIGVQIGYKSLRSNIHILEYFIVGLATCGFCRSKGWKVWIGALIGCGIGLLDESLKVLLPQREFSGIDLIKDCFGVGNVLFVTFIINQLGKQKR